MARHARKIVSALAVILASVSFSVLLPLITSGKGLGGDAVVVWVFDVGQGDAIFIDGPEGKILIDGGPSAQIIEKLTHILAPWDREIDGIINTHPHADHVTGLVHVLNRYKVSRIYDSGQLYTTDVFLAFANFDPQPLAASDTLDLGNEISFEILWPQPQIHQTVLRDPNAGSVAALLTIQGKHILLTGDIGVQEEYAILEDLPDIDVLKVGHQGSFTSTSWELLEKAKPDISVISVGENNYGHPSPLVLERLERFSRVFRTDKDGDIRIRIRNGQIDIKTFDL